MPILDDLLNSLKEDAENLDDTFGDDEGPLTGDDRTNAESLANAMVSDAQGIQTELSLSGTVLNSYGNPDGLPANADTLRDAANDACDEHGETSPDNQRIADIAETIVFFITRESPPQSKKGLLQLIAEGP